MWENVLICRIERGGEERRRCLMVPRSRNAGDGWHELAPNGKRAEDRRGEVYRVWYPVLRSEDGSIVLRSVSGER